MHRHERAAAVLVLAAAALLLAPGRRFDSADCAFGEATYQEAGEGLLHGVAGGTPPAYHMPGASLATACLRAHAGDGARDAWLRLARGGPPLLAFAVAASAGGLAAASATAAILVWAAPEPACHPQALLSVLVVLLAGTLAAWASRPDPARAWAVAAVLGASLALRSTLAFFPPLLALWAWKRGPRRSALIIGLAPYLAVAPWAAAMLAAEGRLLLFEGGQAGDNIIAGALGLVGTFEGDSSALAAGLPDPLRFLETLSWAAREVLAHPARTLDAALLRTVFVVRLNPALAVCALLGSLSAWRRPQVRAWGLLGFYLVAVHVLMAVQANYFVPLWPVLALLAAAPLGAPAFRLGRVLERPGRGLGGAMILAGCAAALLAASGAMLVALRYGAQALARAPDSRAALEEAAARAPGDGTLRLWSGLLLLQEGRLAEARAAFMAAAAAGVARARPLAAWAQLLSGAAAGFEPEPDLPCAARALSVFFGAEALASQGQEAAARAAAAAAVEARRDCAFLRSPDAAASARLKAPAQAVRGLLADLAPFIPRGRTLAAPRLLAEAFAARGPDPETWRALAIGLQDLGDFEGAVAVHDRMAAARTGGAAALADRGVALALAGRRDEARVCLQRALDEDPALAAAALSLGALYEGEGRTAAARAVYARALALEGGTLRSELRRRLAVLNRSK